MTVGKSYLYDILFEMGSSDILPRHTRGIDQAIWRWPRLPEHRIKIVGYAESLRECKRLALSRAEAVHRYLIDSGIPDTRIDGLIAVVETTAVAHDDLDYLRRVDLHLYNARLVAEGKLDEPPYFPEPPSVER